MEALKTSSSANKDVVHQPTNKVLLAQLSRFQRLLLITDGTVTELLEQYLDEAIKVVKLSETTENDLTTLPSQHQAFINTEHLPVLKRSVLLQGQTTLTNWTYAESSILLNHLQKGFRTDLLNSKQPIGKLWDKYKTETYKTIFQSHKIKAGKLAEHFGIQENDIMISRTYGVYSNQKLIMVITETFPDCFFCDG